jgi:hypothetical protein
LEPISRFELKSKAGNIIPAIATSNAIIAGSIVMESIKMINKGFGIPKQVQRLVFLFCLEQGFKFFLSVF